jgi:hypothetical protein
MQPDRETARQPDSQTARQPDSQTARQPDSQTARQPDSQQPAKVLNRQLGCSAGWLVCRLKSNGEMAELRESRKAEQMDREANI